MFESNQPLPAELNARYVSVSVLKHNEQGFSCLAKERHTGKKVLLKVARSPEAAEQLRNEKRMLEFVHGSDQKEAAGFPTVLDFGEDPEPWLARTWVEGHTLDALVESRPERPGLERNAALDCAISVAEKLTFLHALQPPVIHRDIKPQNVVIDPQGTCHLIDFGISRKYRSGGETDTTVSGTRATSPPEQFGYRQTDERSDIFSVGVLLRYALTGEYSDSEDARLDKDLKAIIDRATHFDPAGRYQQASEMLGDLLQARFGRNMLRQQPRRLRWPVVVLSAMLALSACVLLLTVPSAIDQGIFRNLLQRFSDSYSFREPLIEQAVRAALGKPDGPISRRELEQVTSIHIYGRQVYEQEEQFWFCGQFDYARDEAMRDSGLYQESGGISSLEDILNMPNLREMCLYNQNLTSIGALRGTDIHRLGLGHNPIDSLEPLRDNDAITYLNLCSLEITDLSVLRTLPSLSSLNISSMPIRSIALLEDLPIQELALFGVDVADTREYERLKTLEVLDIGAFNSGILSSLATLPRLRDLTVSHPMGVPIADLSCLEQLEMLYYFGEETAVPDSETVILPKLRSLVLPNAAIPSFRFLAGMPKLGNLNIIFSTCESVEGLDDVPLLQIILCSEEIAARIRERYPDASWNIFH